MSDPDVIAYIYPFRGEGQKAAAATINKYEASPMYIHPLAKSTRLPSAPPDHDSRATTEDPHDESDNEDDNGPFRRDGGLAIRFSVGARSRSGVVFGTDKRSDIVISGISGVSRFHMAITFDAQNRLIVRDLGSRFGTHVTYGQGTIAARKSNFSWLLDGPDILGPSRTTVVRLAKSLQFEVVVPRHDIKSKAYLENVETYRLGTLDVDVLTVDITLQQSGLTTAIPSAIQSPLSSQDTAVIKHLGQGSYATVTYMWNASSGKEYAIKEPLEKHILSGSVNTQKWMEEARILSRISHDHVVKIFDLESTPHPRLGLEYLPGGSLDAHRDLSTIENIQILCQLLSALEYLHKLDPPVAHRDIKPANILVEYRRPSNNDIRVKFGDFGLAKESSYLSTVCGSLKYEAPEIFNMRIYVNSRQSPPFHKYDAAVDIYSLGVTVGSLEYQLPQYEDSYTFQGLAWANIMHDHFENLAFVSQLMEFLSQNMVVIDTRARKSASECYADALLLLADFQSGATTPSASGSQTQAGTASTMSRKQATQTTQGATSPPVQRPRGMRLRSGRVVAGR